MWTNAPFTKRLGTGARSCGVITLVHRSIQSPLGARSTTAHLALALTRHRAQVYFCISWALLTSTFDVKFLVHRQATVLLIDPTNDSQQQSSKHGQTLQRQSVD